MRDDDYFDGESQQIELETPFTSDDLEEMPQPLFGKNSIKSIMWAVGFIGVGSLIAIFYGIKAIVVDKDYKGIWGVLLGLLPLALLVIGLFC